MSEIFINPDCKALRLDKFSKVGHILWADDLVLLSDSDTRLQKMHFSLTDYSAKINCLALRIRKLWFSNKSGRFIRASYKSNDILKV